METVTENTVVEIGRFYLVRCAEHRNENGVFLGYVPVIGELHRDPQFGFTSPHIHVDGRFRSSLVDENGRTNSVITPESEKMNTHFSAIVLKRRKCIRLTTGVKPPWIAQKYWQWRDSMIGKSCAGKKCPHLGTTMHEIDGELVCPLHSLRGDIKKEIIIK